MSAKITNNQTLRFPLLQSPSFGLKEGEAFNDATFFGDFPIKQQIVRIKELVFYGNSLVDGVDVTYILTDGKEHTVEHHELTTGANAGVIDKKSVKIAEFELLVGVTGREGIPDNFANKPYLNDLKLHILNTTTGNLRTEGPFGVTPDVVQDGPPFAVGGGPIIALAGQLFKSGVNPKYALSLSFLRSPDPSFTYGDGIYVSL